MKVPTNHKEINGSFLIGVVKPAINKEKIAAFFFKKHKDIEDIVGSECGACYVSFLNPKDYVIGGIMMSSEHKDMEFLFHESIHATHDYIQIVKPKFKLGKTYSNVKSKKSIDEERFCRVSASIIKEMFKLYKF